jgi:hypothetical protein
VKSQSNKELWSGCSGIGLERWASAFYAQKGLDPDGWPAAFREIVGECLRGSGSFEKGMNSQKKAIQAPLHFEWGIPVTAR